MKRPTRKLAVRRETLRTLGQLRLEQALAGVQGGGTRDEAGGCPTGVVVFVVTADACG